MKPAGSKCSKNEMPALSLIQVVTVTGDLLDLRAGMGQAQSLKPIPAGNGFVKVPPVIKIL